MPKKSAISKLEADLLSTVEALSTLRAQDATDAAVQKALSAKLGFLEQELPNVLSLDFLRNLRSRCQVDTTEHRMLQETVVNLCVKMIDQLQIDCAYHPSRSSARESLLQRRRIYLNELSLIVKQMSELQPLCLLANRFTHGSPANKMVRARMMQVFGEQIILIHRDPVALISCHRALPPDLRTNVDPHLTTAVSRITSIRRLQGLLKNTVENSFPYTLIAGRIRVLTSPDPASVVAVAI